MFVTGDLRLDDSTGNDQQREYNRRHQPLDTIVHIVHCSRSIELAYSRSIQCSGVPT
jgi:hypothetical protein